MNASMSESTVSQRTVRRTDRSKPGKRREPNLALPVEARLAWLTADIRRRRAARRARETNADAAKVSALADALGPSHVRIDFDDLEQPFQIVTRPFALARSD